MQQFGGFFWSTSETRVLLNLKTIFISFLKFDLDPKFLRSIFSGL